MAWLLGLAFLAAATFPPFRILYGFQLGFPSMGAAPAGALTAASHGVLYGTAQVGGTSVFSYGGAVFALTPQPDGSYGYSVLHYFTGDDHPSIDGAHPSSGVVSDAAGDLFGTTVYGGTTSGSGWGTVFEVRRSGSRFDERVLYRFSGGNARSTDGAFPSSAPILDEAGSLYGTTAAGGRGACTITGTGCGTVYELVRTGSTFRERILYRFAGGMDGATPQAKLVADGRGNLYGTTQFGGGMCPDTTLGCGTVFELTPNGGGYAEIVIYRFAGGSTDGVAPLSGLLADRAGDLYGTTDTGGAGMCAPVLFTFPGCGTVFELRRNGAGYVESILHSFLGGSSDGYRPEAALVPGPGGLMFGTTAEGGSGECFVYAGYHFGCGTVYVLSPIGGVTVLKSFGPDRTGYSPNDLLIDRSGRLFGTTSADWHTAGGGAAFEIDI